MFSNYVYLLIYCYYNSYFNMFTEKSFTMFNVVTSH